MANQQREPQKGDYYATPHEKGGYGIVKVLMVEEGGIHLRSFSNVYSMPPISVDPEELTMQPMQIEKNEAGEYVGIPVNGEGENSLAQSLNAMSKADTFGIGHFPLAIEGFWEMNPHFIQSGTLSEEDMEGLNMYLEQHEMLEEEPPLTTIEQPRDGKVRAEQERPKPNLLAWAISTVLTLLAYFAIIQGFWYPESVFVRFLLVLVLYYVFRFFVERTLPKKP